MFSYAVTSPFQFLQVGTLGCCCWRWRLVLSHLQCSCPCQDPSPGLPLLDCRFGWCYPHGQTECRNEVQPSRSVHSRCHSTPLHQFNPFTPRSSVPSSDLLRSRPCICSKHAAFREEHDRTKDCENATNYISGYSNHCQCLCDTKPSPEIHVFVKYDRSPRQRAEDRGKHQERVGKQ